MVVGLIDLLLLLTLYFYSMEAEAGIPTPLLAVQMYSPFACLSTSRRSRERPDMRDIDPTYKYDL